jgi:hypothetical protein
LFLPSRSASTSVEIFWPKSDFKGRVPKISGGTFSLAGGLDRPEHTMVGQNPGLNATRTLRRMGREVVED